MSILLQQVQMGMLASLLLCTGQKVIAQTSPVVCDDFDNDTVQDAGDGQTSYWRPSGKVTESEGKVTLHAFDRPHSKTALSSPLEKRISFFHQPITIAIHGIGYATSEGIEPRHTQLRFGFRDANHWTFRNTVDALMVNISGAGKLVVAWKVAKKQLDPEAGNQLLVKELDMTLGPVTDVTFSVDGTGDTITWSLTVKQADTLTELAGVIGELDTKALRDGWNAADHKAVVTAEVQGRLGDDYKGKFVNLLIDQCCISSSRATQASVSGQ